jgi:predicted porin
MNKKLLSVAVSAALVAPAAMAGDVTMYGKVHIATSSYDADINSGDAWDISSHATRLGFKGTEDLGGSLKAVWQIELGIDASDDADDDEGGNTVANGDGLGYRNTFVGLTGNWGTAVIGRHDTPMKISTGSLDIFGDTIADYNGNGADDEPNGAGNLGYGLLTTALVQSIPLANQQGLGFVDLRVDQAIAYISPSFNGLTLAAAIVQPGMDRGDTGPYDATAADGFAEAYSVAALYSNGPFFASLAWERLDEDLIEELLRVHTAAQPAIGDEHRWRMGLGYTANGMHVGFVYEDQEHAVDGLDMKRWQISGSYSFGNNVIKAMYGENEADCSFDCSIALATVVATVSDGVTPVIAGIYDGYDVDQWAIGLDHNFSKRTKAYILYTDVNVDQGQDVIPTQEDGSWDGFSLGLVHSF